MEQQYREILLNKILVNGKQPRKFFREQGLKELAQSIKTNGVIQPVLVRPSSKKEGHFDLIAGERRVRASLLARLVTIPAMVCDVEEAKVRRLQIIENLQRENVTFLEEALAIKTLREDEGLDVTEIKKIIGKSDMYIYSQLQVSMMPAEALAACEKGYITKTVAWEIAKLPTPDQMIEAVSNLSREDKANLVSTHAARLWIRERFEGKVSKKGKKNSIQARYGNDYEANWKKYLLGFSAEQFERFKRSVDGRTEISVWAKTVGKIVSGSQAETV